MFRLSKKNKGFTLVELVIVISVLGILMIVVVPKMIDVHQNSRQNITHAEIRQIQKAIMGDRSSGYEGFLDHLGRIPLNAETLEVLIDSTLLDPGSPAIYDPMTERGWNGPYLENSDMDATGVADSLEDSWGNQYHYDATLVPPVIWSNGPDLVDDNRGNDDIYVELGDV